MKKIKCIIIDDEAANLNVLKNMLTKHCPSISIAGFARSADEGYRLISETEPNIVFLDIKMPGKSGFDLLLMFKEIRFSVIFVSGFDQYAIQAFEFNALDYILKPIDHMKLIRAVNKVEKAIENKDANNVIHFIHNLDEKNQLLKSIPLHRQDKVHMVDIDDICYVHALRGYSEIVTTDNQRFLSAKVLSDYEDLLSPFTNFLRVNKSMLINIRYIRDYSKGSTCFINIKNGDSEIEVSRRKKTDIIQYLKVMNEGENWAVSKEKIRQ
jgi:two-component system LytT family response regulator